MVRILSTLLLALSLACNAEPIGFNSHIRPILSDHCFACHGFDANAREADLRLDTPEAAYARGDNGTPIVPGDPDASLIWQRIISSNPDDVMPPADHHLKLDKKEKNLIRQWIHEGAKYEQHWTFIPVKKPNIPGTHPHPIDALVSQRLDQEKLTLSPLAEKHTLIRRLSFDLRGLPPTAEEISTYLADDSPSAWTTLVDSFLADPSFGERFAWPWLDAARYADSNGFQGDRERTMWPWRDWVIDAINRNLPYDDFTIWQIAGDLLPNATHQQKLATGFLRNHAINGEGGSIPEENRVNYVFDMAETVGTVWMGLTFNCCRCHDHKYDPLAQSEYYSLTAFFNQTPVNGGGGDPQTKPVLAAPSIKQQAQEKDLQLQLTQSKAQIQSLTKDLLPKQPAWETTQLNKGESSIWNTFTFTTKTTDHKGLLLKTLPDQSLLATGDNPKNATFTLTAPVPDEPISSLRLDALRHPSMTQGRIARSDSGNFVLTSVEIYLHQKGQARRQLSIKDPKATFEQTHFSIQRAIDQNPSTGWAVLNGKKIDQDHSAIFPLAEPLTPTPDSHLEIILRHDTNIPYHYLGRFQISHTSVPSAKLSDQTNPLLPLLKIAPKTRRKEHQKHIRDSFLASQPAHIELSQKATSIQEKITQLKKAAPRVMIMADQAKKRKTHILAVGSYQDKGQEVQATTPAILPPLNATNPNRLDLARWLVSPGHPLTSRVTINRLWQNLFGTGLIKSPEDLGVQSEIPVHPDLLDFLAADFIESDWDFKKLIKTIVTSRTYQQSSTVDSLALERDPHNRLLARGPRHRLPSWMIRDQALALSDRLVPTLGGPPVKPWQPAGLWAEATFGKKKYTPDSGDKLRRRTLYTFWRRISAPPMLFDTPKREICDVSAYLTNSPLHALATLNDPLYLEASRALAERSLKMNPDAPLSTAFQIITSRPPTDPELQAIKSLYQNTLTHFKTHPNKATTLLSSKNLPTPDSPDHPTQAALTTTILSLLNTDEALTKE